MFAEHQQHLSSLSMLKRKITETYIKLKYVIIMNKFKDNLPLGNSRRIFESSFQICWLPAPNDFKLIRSTIMCGNRKKHHAH